MGKAASCLSSQNKNAEGTAAKPVQPAEPSGQTTASVGNTGLNFGFETGFKAKYTLGKELGRGQYGVTYLCTDKATGLQYAAKKIPKRILTDAQTVEDVKREVQILKVLKGKPNIVEFFGAYESSEEVVMVLELCTGGELFQRLLKNGRYSEQDASRVMRQILQTVADCHVNGVIHRDLKPENFLFCNMSEDSPVKVTDFGLSDFFTLDPPKVFDDVAGSAYYVAPEVLRRRYGPAADLWSCGVIMYILLTGEVPFWATTEAGIFKQVLTGRLYLNKGAWQGISKEAKVLLLSLLNRDAKARISAAKALAAPWICQDGVAPDTPLDIKIVNNMKRFAGYNNVKKAILIEIAKTFNESEILHLKHQFALMDKDNSGTITIEEMIQALAALKTGEAGETVYKSEDIRTLMKTMDVDQDGQIDYMEFVAASMSTYQMSHGISPGSTASWLDRVRVVFDKIDEDGNGFITREELTKLMGASEDVQALITDADKNGDGMIDYDEFQHLLRENARSESVRAPLPTPPKAAAA